MQAARSGRAVGEGPPEARHVSRELQGAGSTATGRLLQGRRQPAWGMDGSFQNSGAERGWGGRATAGRPSAALACLCTSF